MAPLVSVVMAVHNGQRFLNPAVTSILNQTFGDFEFIIVNDGSTDMTAKVLREFDDGRIRLFINKHRLGLTRSLNIALGKASGKYIARMDADDISVLTRFERQIAFLEYYGEVGVVGTSFFEIDKNDHILGSVYMPSTDCAIRNTIFRVNPFFHGSVMIKKKVFETVGSYNETFQYAQDYELWFRILDKYKGANMDGLLMKRRKHSTAITQAVTRRQARFAYKACAKGKELIQSKPIDLFYMRKHQVIAMVPSFFLHLLNNLRSHNRVSKSGIRYVRDLR